MKIRVLKKEDIEKMFTMSDAIEASKDALETYSKGMTDIPLRTVLEIESENAQSIYMPGYASDRDALGVKIVSVFPNNQKKGLSTTPATMVLVDEQTGEVSSIIDGTFLTQLRTGAVSGAATELLSRRDSKVFTIIGTGGQAKSQIEAVLSVRDIEVVKVYNRSLSKAKEFIEKIEKDISENFDVEFIPTDSSKDAVRDADIITTVTTAKSPVFDGRDLKKGVHINAVGSFKPDMQEIDEFTLINADKVYVDTRDGVLNESGDFLIPIKHNTFKPEDIEGELGEVVAQSVRRREGEDEITLFKTVGSGVLDIVTAKRIYEKASEKEIGQVIEF